MTKTGERYQHLFRMGLVFILCIVTFSLTNLITYPIANYFIKNEMVNWTMYEGFAEDIFLVYLIAIGIYFYYQPAKHKLITAILMFGIYRLLFTFYAIYTHYTRFYVATTSNGKYSFQLFTESLTEHFGTIISSDFYTFLVLEFCQLINIILIIAAISKIKNIKQLKISTTKNYS